MKILRNTLVLLCLLSSLVFTFVSCGKKKTASANGANDPGKVSGVTLTPETLTMMIGEVRNFEAIVSPDTATNKKVGYSTSNSSVATVDAIGKVKAVGAGTATITVTTGDGGFTDTCVITVTSDTPPIRFDFTGIPGIAQMGDGYLINTPTFDLTSGIWLATGTVSSNIGYRITSGNWVSVDGGGYLTFAASSVVCIEAYVGDADNPTYRTEILIMYNE